MSLSSGIGTNSVRLIIMYKKMRVILSLKVSIQFANFESSGLVNWIKMIRLRLTTY